MSSFNEDEELAIVQGNVVEKKEDSDEDDLFGDNSYTKRSIKSDDEDDIEEKVNGDDMESEEEQEEEGEEVEGENEESKKERRHRKKLERKKRREKKREKRDKRRRERGSEGENEGDGEEMENEDVDQTGLALLDQDGNEEDLHSGDDEEQQEDKPTIKPPINLVHVNSNSIPKAHLMKLKLLNILGIQPLPFDPLTFNDEMENDRKSFNLESVIRWKWGLDDNGRPIKESNTRLVKWSDGSCHLFIGNEALEIKEHELNSEQFYIYSNQEGFIECEGKINSRVAVKPVNIRSKVHQRLSESITKQTKKVGKIKSILTTLDPELEKERREKEENERIRKSMAEEKKKNNQSLKSYFEDSDEEGDSSYRSRNGGSRGSGSRKKSAPKSRSTSSRFDDDEGSEEDDYNSEEDDDFVVDDEEDVDDDEESEDDEFINSKKGNSKKRDRENPSALSEIKKYTSNKNDEDSDNEDIVRKKLKRKVIDDMEDD